MVEPGGSLAGPMLAAFQGYLSRAFRKSLVVINETRLNCLANTRAALDKAFETGAEFAVVAEEDLAVSDDVLEYFTWAQRYRADPDVTAVCAHTFRAGPRSLASAAVRVDWFSPLVWGTWRDRWEEFIRPAWAGAMGNPQGWDLNLRLQIVAEKKVSVFPGRSRSIHRGTTSTMTAAPLAEHFYKASLTNCFQPHYNPQDWREVPRAKEMELVV